MTRRPLRVAVLGAGIMGTSLALLLARRNIDVTLYEKESVPLACASRWNEGKIHLGYLYGADPTMRTARHLLPGGLAFRRMISDLVGSDISSYMTPDDDIYLVHRHSVVTADALWSSFNKVNDLVRDHPDARGYFTDASNAPARRLPAAAIRDLSGSDDIVAGFITPERSVNTRLVADDLLAALENEPRIRLRTNVTIHQAKAVDSADGPWCVGGASDLDETFDIVVNALWNGRLQIDRTAGLEPESVWSNRYRLSIFARTSCDVDMPSATIAVGPFGDIKNYNRRDFYLSWYPAGLVAENNDIALERPPPFNGVETEMFIAQVRDALGSILPGTAQIFESASEMIVQGGYIFAIGQGGIGDPQSTLHRRDRFGIRRLGNYFSVDTGKYSTAPWLAQTLAERICGD